MVVMTVDELPVFHTGPMTRAELDALPDDGRRHELIDGVLIVTPAPRPRHQDLVGGLYFLLRTHLPAGLKVFTGPLDVALDDLNVLEPDLLVAPRSDFTKKDLPTAPSLAVEVLSPSTRRYDLMVKYSRYEEAGTQSYWVIDPNGPTLTAWELVDGRYVEVASVTGDEAFEAQLPFPVRIVPNELLDPEDRSGSTD